MKIILNDHPRVANFSGGLAELIEGADTLSVAVSYLQMGGWELFSRRTAGLSKTKMRMVCTDQLAITQPAAVCRAIDSGIQIRNYAGRGVYHPKVYIAHNSVGRPIRYLLGSANMSYAALTSSVEAGVLGADEPGLATLNDWFDTLFRQRSERFTPERLRKMESAWRAAASQRARARLVTRRGVVIPPGAAVPIEPEDLDTLEDVFATIQLPIGLLNIDYAANNVRNIEKVREVIRDYVRASSKQSSELKLLGFMSRGNLSPLGRSAAAARSLEDLARLWCAWLQATPDASLAGVNAKLVVAKRVFTQFWRLQPEVRDYFLENATRPRDRRLLQTIELLCNAREVVQDFSLDDFRALAPLLSRPESLAPHIRGDVMDYFENKGTRSWDFPDRRIVPEAWRRAAAGA